MINVIEEHEPDPDVALYFPVVHPVHMLPTSSKPGLHRHDGLVVLPLSKHVLLGYTHA